MMFKYISSLCSINPVSVIAWKIFEIVEFTIILITDYFTSSLIPVLVSVYSINMNHFRVKLGMHHLSSLRVK